jgi:hypothetical protein
VTINRVQTNTHLISYSTPFSLALAQTPAAGNVLIATFGSFNGYFVDSSVTSITQSNVAWSRRVKNQSSDNVFDVEVWVGVVSSSGGAGQTLTVTLNSAPSQGVTAEICEYSGLSPNMDVYAVNNGNGVTTDTGTTSMTRFANELWVGAIFTYNREQGSERNGFTKLDGVYNGNFNSFVYLEKIVSSTSTANSGTTTTGIYDPSNWYGCIATFVANGTNTTVTVPYDGRYAGDGSKQTTWYYAGSSTIMSVSSNLPSNSDKSAIIENLVIDGLNQSGTIGLDLTNVYNSYIRNLTIMNCDVGIRVQINGSSWAHGNRFEHIRMVGVKTGIQFIGNTNGKYFSHTTIDDVEISTRENYSNAVGILINSNAKLYNSFIKSIVWLKGSYGTGMEVDGELKLSIVNFEAQQDSGRTNGIGVLVASGANICDNQSFLVTTGNILTANQVVANGSTDITLVKKSL